MFGQKVHDEVTSNILLTKGYPHAISVIIVIFIAIIPLTKIPLKYVPFPPIYTTIFTRLLMTSTVLDPSLPSSKLSLD